MENIFESDNFKNLLIIKALKDIVEILVNTSSFRPKIDFEEDYRTAYDDFLEDNPELTENQLEKKIDETEILILKNVLSKLE